MKTKDEVKIQIRPAVYTILYPKFCEAALELGYALAIHGSMGKDFDLVAIPWKEYAASVTDLVKALDAVIGDTMWSEHNFKSGSITIHGLHSFTLSLYSDWFIDLKIVPPNISYFKK